MPVQNIKGDLFETDAGIIAHGCNCKGAMGSGIAAIIRSKYPVAYDHYIDEYTHYDELVLGEVQYVYIPEEDRYIANCMTQDEYGTHKRQVNYEAIYTCFESLEAFARKHKISHVALPAIGAGLAGGSWNIILTILKEVFDDSPVTANYHTID